MNHKEQYAKAFDALVNELSIFVARLSLECNCTNLEAVLLAQAVLHSLINNLGKDSMAEFEQLLVQIRKESK